MRRIRIHKLAVLHGISEAALADYAKLKPKAYLQACNSYLQSTFGNRKRLAFMRATKQRIPRGIPVKGHKKCVIAPYRHAHRQRHWLEVKEALRAYVYDVTLPPPLVMHRGHLKKVADFIGCESSQVHRWICPVCEHDAEPSFSIGMAIVEFLDENT